MIWETCVKVVLSEPACVERSLWEDVPSFVEVQWDLVYHVEKSHRCTYSFSFIHTSKTPSVVPFLSYSIFEEALKITCHSWKVYMCIWLQPDRIQCWFLSKSALKRMVHPKILSFTHPFDVPNLFDSLFSSVKHKIRHFVRESEWVFVDTVKINSN